MKYTCFIPIDHGGFQRAVALLVGKVDDRGRGGGHLARLGAADQLLHPLVDALLREGRGGGVAGAVAYGAAVGAVVARAGIGRGLKNGR